MKKTVLRLTAVILTIAALFALAGCFGEQQKRPDIKLSDLYGTWERVNSKVSEKFNFKENMSYTRVKDGDFTRGTYSVEGYKILLKPDAVEQPSEHVAEMKGDTMIWGDISIKVEYKKVG